MKFIKNVSITFGTRIFGIIFSRIVHIILARMLGPAGKGVYTIATTVPSLLFSLGNLGLTSSTAYFTSKKKYELRVIASTVLILGIIIGFILAVGAIIIINCISFEFLKGISRLLLIMTILVLPFDITRSYYSSILLGTNRIWSYNFVRISEQINLLCLFLILYLFSKNIILNAITSYLGASIISNGITIALVVLKTRIKLNLNYQFVKDGVTFGIKAYGESVVSFFEKRTDIFVVNYFLTLRDVGFYSLGAGLGEALWYIPRSVATMLFPKIASLSPEEAGKFTPKVFRHVLLITIISAICLGLLGKIIIEVLYGKVFLPSLPLLWLFLPGAVAGGMNKLLISDLIGRGKPVFGLLSSTVSLISLLTFDIILIPRIGVIGAPISASLSYILVSFVILMCYLNISGNHIFTLVRITYEDLALYKNLIKNKLLKVRG
ncbi:MAG: oligosaccharide flippase family protein [bacterium]